MRNLGRVAPSRPFLTILILTSSMFTYFIHPVTLSAMDNVLKMRMKEGAAGYGIYVMLLEVLRSSESYKIKWDPSVIAWSIHEPDVELLCRVVQDYNLFSIEEDQLSSPWLVAAMAQHEEKRQKLSEAGKKSAAAKAARKSSDVATSLNTPPQPSCNDVGGIEQQTNQINNQNQIKEDKITQPKDDGGWLDYSDEDIKSLTRSKSVLFDPAEHSEWILTLDGCNPNPLAAAGVAYKMRLDQVTALYEMMQGCRIGSPRLMAFIAALKHCQQSKFVPDHPFAYFASQLKTLPMA